MGKSLEPGASGRFIDFQYIVGGLSSFLFFLIPVFLGLSYFGLDFTRVDVPFVCEIKRQLHSHGDFWISRSLGNGEPLFANPQAQLFYPIRWIEALLPEAYAVSIGVAFHMAIAATGMIFLATSFGIVAPYALFAGLFFVFSGTALDLIIHTAYIAGAAWLPWIWGFARVLINSGRSRKRVLGLIFSCVLCLFSADVYDFTLALGVMTLESLFYIKPIDFLRSRRFSKKQLSLQMKRAKPVWIAFCSVCIAVAIGLVQWASALGELKLSQHLDTFVGISTEWSLDPPLVLATLIPGLTTPYFNSHLNFLNLYVKQGEGSLGLAWNLTPYLGLLWLSLICLSFKSLLQKSEKKSAPWVLVISFLMALGYNTPFLPWFSKIIPIFGHFRYPEKYFVLTTLAASLIAAHSVQDLLTLKNKKKYFQYILFIIVCLALAGEVALVLYLETQPDFSLDEALPLLIQSLVPVLSALAVLSLARNRKFLFMVPLLLVFDLWLSFPYTVQTGPPFTQLHSPLKALNEPPLQGTQGSVLCFSSDVVEASLGSRNEPMSEWNRFMTLRLLTFPNLNACEGLSSGTSYSILSTSFQNRLNYGVSLGLQPSARALGCNYLIARKTPQGTSHSVPIANISYFKNGGAPLAESYQIEHPIEPAFISKHPKMIGDPEQFIVSLNQSKTPEDLGSWIDFPLTPDKSLALLPTGDGATQVEARWIKPSHISVKAQGKGSAIIGVRTTYAAGWSARQNGRRLETVRVGGVFLGAIVDDVQAGEVEFLYSPPHLGMGIAAALGGVAGLIFIL